jgi:SAM-dependent methyltransferase
VPPLLDAVGVRNAPLQLVVMPDGRSAQRCKWVRLLSVVQPKDIVVQFTAQVDRFVTSPHVNEPEPVARFLAAVEPHGDERALDVGCGPGLLARAFAPRVREFVGVDLTPAMVEKARAIARETGLANAHFQVADALKLPFETGSFDLALTRLALHHMPDVRGVVREMARVTRAGGKIGLFDLTTSESTEESAYLNFVERLRDPSHARALPISEAVQVVGLAGFDLDRVDTTDLELDVDDWIARAEQSPDEARQTRELLADTIGTRRFGGRPVRRDEAGKLKFMVRYMIVVGTRRERLPAP